MTLWVSVSAGWALCREPVLVSAQMAIRLSNWEGPNCRALRKYSVPPFAEGLAPVALAGLSE